MAKKERIVLANSVGIDSNGWALIHSPSRWTNSTRNLNVFTYYPWELAYATALLKKETDYYIKLLDGCLEKLDGEAYFKRICEENPTFLVMEPATRTWNDDCKLMERVKKACDTQLIVVGQHAIAFPEEVQAMADYVVIGEYEYTVLDIVRGKPRHEIVGLYPNARRPLLDINSLPWPEDDDVSRLHYGMPGEPSSEYLEVQAYATRGCPMNCTFCVARHMYYDKPNWRPRDPEDVVRELRYLKDKYPQMEGIFFDEECHNTQKKFVLDLTRAIKRNTLDSLKIEAMCTYYTLDEEMMNAMRNAGYYLLRIGIETAGENAARGINLGSKFDIEKLKRVLRYAKSIDMKMYGTFTFGAPGSSREDDEKTLQLMDEIIGDGLLWRFQTSICTPQPGGPFYDWAEKNNLIKTHEASDYDGGNRVVLEYPHYTSEEIMKVYTRAQTYYDVALRKRVEARIDETKQALMGKPWKKILIMRSSRMTQLEIILKLLREDFSGAQIDVIGQMSVSHELQVLKGQGVINAIYFYGDGFFDPMNIPVEINDEIKQIKYDAVGIVYHNRYGQGYENVEAVVDQFGIDEWFAINAEGSIFTQEEIAKRRALTGLPCECSTETHTGA